MARRGNDSGAGWALGGAQVMLSKIGRRCPPPSSVGAIQARSKGLEIKVHRHHESFDVRVRVLHARLCVGGPRGRRDGADAQEEG